MNGVALGTAGFARSVQERYGRFVAGASRAPFALVAPGGDRAPGVVRERFERMTIHERSAPVILAPRIEVSVLRPSPRIANRDDRRASPQAPAMRILERSVRRVGPEPPGKPELPTPARATPRALPPPAMVLPRVERVLRRDAVPREIRPSALPAMPAPRSVEPARRAEPRFTDADVSVLTDRVMRSIDQRLRAYRERLGRA